MRSYTMICVLSQSINFLPPILLTVLMLNPYEDIQCFLLLISMSMITAFFHNYFVSLINIQCLQHDIYSKSIPSGRPLHCPFISTAFIYSLSVLLMIAAAVTHIFIFSLISSVSCHTTSSYIIYDHLVLVNKLT